MIEYAPEYLCWGRMHGDLKVTVKGVPIAKREVKFSDLKDLLNPEGKFLLKCFSMTIGF